jgi:hypothetical protein
MKKLHLLAEYLADPSGMRLFDYVRQLFANLKDYSTIDELGRSIVKELGLIVEACPSSIELVRPAATFASKHCGEVALIVGESGAAFNWFKSTIRCDITINSLSNEEITIEPMRFVELLCRSPSEFLSWVEHIFYYSGRYGGLVEELRQRL